MKVFVIDVGLCVGCYACQFVCKDEHVGNDWSPIAKPQPDTGQFWMRLDEYIRGTVPKVEMHYIANPCYHCDEPPCLPACPVSGCIYKREDGLVIRESALRGGTVFSHGDHRVAMALAVAATSAEGPVTIDGMEAVSVTYPEFIDHLTAAGGQVEILEP